MLSLLPFIVLGALLAIALAALLFIPGEEGRRKRALKCQNKKIETTLEPTHDGLYVVVLSARAAGGSLTYGSLTPKGARQNSYSHLNSLIAAM